jgi:hypothetical protein
MKIKKFQNGDHINSDNYIIKNVKLIWIMEALACLIKLPSKVHLMRNKNKATKTNLIEKNI